MMFLDLLVKLIIPKGLGNNFKLIFFIFNSGIVDHLSFILQLIVGFRRDLSIKNLCQELLLLITDIKLDLGFQLHLELLKEIHLQILSFIISFLV